MSLTVASRIEKRRRDAYICFWANRAAFEALDQAAKERGVTRSDMARSVFGAGMAALGITVKAPK